MGAPEEVLAVLRLVAAGTVAPDEALALLRALGPEDPGLSGGDAGIPLRVHFQLDEQQRDFVLVVDAGAAVADVLGMVLDALPPAARRFVGPDLLGGLGAATVGAAPEDVLLRLEDAGGPFHLSVTRHVRRTYGRRGRGFRAVDETDETLADAPQVVAAGPAAGPEAFAAPTSERMAVLRLLEQGRITAAEATELLKALREPGPGNGNGFTRPAADWAEQAARRAAERAQRAAERAALRGRRAAEYWSQHADEVAARAAEHAARAVEQVGENVGRIFGNLPDFMERAAKAGWGVWGPGHRFEEVVEGTLEGDGGPAGLDIEGWNGAVLLRPVDGAQVRLVLKKTVHAVDEAEARELALAVRAEVVGRQVTVRRVAGAPAWPGGGLSIEAYLPRSAVWGGLVGTDNGQIDGEGLHYRGLRFETSNGRVRLGECLAEDVGVLTSNGGIEVDGLRGRAELRTSNGPIAVRPAAEAPEGGADDERPEVDVTAVTTNGTISVRLPAGMAADVDATTSNGRFEVSGLGPSAPRPEGNRGYGRADYRWRSPDWDDATRRARLALRTSNGSMRFE